MWLWESAIKIAIDHYASHWYHTVDIAGPLPLLMGFDTLATLIIILLLHCHYYCQLSLILRFRHIFFRQIFSHYDIIAMPLILLSLSLINIVIYWFSLPLFFHISAFFHIAISFSYAISLFAIIAIIFIIVIFDIAMPYYIFHFRHFHFQLLPATLCQIFAIIRFIIAIASVIYIIYAIFIIIAIIFAINIIFRFQMPYFHFIFSTDISWYFIDAIIIFAISPCHFLHDFHYFFAAISYWFSSLIIIFFVIDTLDALFFIIYYFISPLFILLLLHFSPLLPLFHISLFSHYWYYFHYFRHWYTADYAIADISPLLLDFAISFIISLIFFATFSRFLSRFQHAIIADILQYFHFHFSSFSFIFISRFAF